MSLQMKLELIPRTNVSQVMEDHIGKVYEVIDYWESQPKLEATLQIGDTTHKVKYVLAPPSWLNYIAQGEKFGAYIEDMMFINSEMTRENPDYTPYVLLKLYGEKFVDSGLDNSGRAKHWQSLWGTIRVAGQTMNPNQLYNFLRELEAHESSKFFDLDGQVKEFMKRYEGDSSEGKRKYLEAHHNNRWVAKGRAEEFFASVGVDNSGFRNHSEAIMSAMKDLDLRNLYLATGFVRALAAVEPNSPVQVNPPYNSFAYALTENGNGLTNLVRFVESSEVEGDVIVKTPGKMSSWTALSKRLSYLMHKTEETTRKLAETERKRLDGIIIEAGHKTNQFEKEIESVRALISRRNGFDEAKRMLQAMPVYRQEVAKLEELSTSIARRMQQLTELSDLLVGQI